MLVVINVCRKLHWLPHVNHWVWVLVPLEYLHEERTCGCQDHLVGLYVDPVLTYQGHICKVLVVSQPAKS